MIYSGALSRRRTGTKYPEVGASWLVKSSPFANSRETNQAIREWAAKNGGQVSERGRIPASVVEAYNNR